MPHHASNGEVPETNAVACRKHVLLFLAANIEMERMMAIVVSLLVLFWSLQQRQYNSGKPKILTQD